MTSSAVDAQVAVGYDSVVPVALAVLHDGQVLDEVQAIGLGEGGVREFTPASRSHGGADEVILGIAVRRQA